LFNNLYVIQEFLLLFNSIYVSFLRIVSEQYVLSHVLVKCYFYTKSSAVYDDINMLATIHSKYESK